MKLKEILVGIKHRNLNQDYKGLNIDIAEIITDSRKVTANSVFVAIKGTHVDGHTFITQVIEKGCKVIVCDTYESAYSDYTEVVFITVANTAACLGQLAANFYGNASQKMKVVGVTGTNGKTTTATLLYKLFSTLGFKVGLISTVVYRIGNQEYPSTHTTPDAVRLQELFAKMYEAGCDYVFMEVSSHAVHQFRIRGTYFTGGIFTNLTHDHLDYHGDFRSYMQAKKMFFDELPKTAFALVNSDDKHGMDMLTHTKAYRYTYALKQPSDFKGKIMENHLSGLFLQVNGKEVHTPLVGDFNAYNFLATYGAAYLLTQQNPNEQGNAYSDLNEEEILAALSKLTAADGRLETVLIPTKPEVLAIVDYAHTPDALEKVLQTLEQLRTENSRIITVVGCGGDRDKTKRPIMAKIACTYSQYTVLTSDNPRTENPADILKDMEKGIPSTIKDEQFIIIEDRRAAILHAGAFAQNGDIILVAGKGHEKYQEINGIRYDFDDKEVLTHIL